MSITGSSDNGGPHVLLFPCPAPGHIIPIIDLTHLLVTRGMIVTVLIAPNHLPLLQPLLSIHPTSFLQTLILSPPPQDDSQARGLASKLRALAQLRDPIIQWFRSHPSPPVVIVSDFFLGWTHTLAIDLEVPRVVFWPSGAFASSISNSLWRDLPKNNDPGNDDFLISFPNIPNCPIYPWRELSHVYRGYTQGDPDWKFLRDCMLANSNSWGALFNSFDRLERVYINHLKKELGHDRVWAVGPLLPQHDGHNFMGSTDRGGPSSIPPIELMTWLDGKKEDSVVYLCFGSIFNMTEEQMEVVAAALEYSGVHFVWAVKVAGDGDELRMAILDGLEDRVEDKGLVVRGWAPQVTILGHRAVGVYVTHCGWNSVSEGLFARVRMLTWPMGADQFTNAKLLVDQMGVAVRACGNGDWSVPDPFELGQIIKESMSNKTRIDKVRVEQLRDAAREAMEGGSSSRDMEEFVNQINELKNH